MEDTSQNNDGMLVSWAIPEYVKHERGWKWYLTSSIIGIALVLWGVFTANFLFAIIIVMAGLIMFLTSQREPEQVPFAVTAGGILIGDHFHPYYEFRNFSILYEPPHLKCLYLVSEKRVRPLIKIQLEDTDPNTVRKTLLQFLPEDLQRVEESLTEMIARVYKL
ncbi:TPA: hypothetical protein DDZ10_03480 [Candidatus Uhrbacteria bacterium]|nr:MAG: hypothetical protein UY79_C0007G0012 [Parcubacteria group bacterium GW2011_GWA2_53_21]OGL71360.1 MAG: hypothetical protein A3D69_03585 [Candidatus Uhrbacteria bacterium RIFCSPHIGHO2_02_FULL_54_11]HBL39702.1 hypothetical protein [Candidatus Uhrbacteria bacterium]